MTSTSMQTIAAPWTVDAGQWPDVAVAAGSRARAAIARAVFTTAAARLPLRVKLPDGGSSAPGDRPPRSWCCAAPGSSSAASARRA